MNQKVVPWPDFALDADLAAHQLDQAFADDQSQTRAAELAGGGGVDLGEALEEPIEPIGRDSDAGVLHFDTQPRSVSRPARFRSSRPRIVTCPAR